jgi:uncharacterized integral membrane protein
VAGPTSDKSLPTLVGELWDLVVAYAKQETFDPLKSLARYLLWGLPGTVFLAIGVLLLSIAGLRALEQETGARFAANWSWAPYLMTMAGAALVGALLASRIQAERRRAARRRRRSVGKGA